MAMTSMLLKNKHHKKKFAKRMQVRVRQWGKREAATEECRPIFIAAKMVIVQQWQNTSWDGDENQIL